MNYSLVLIHRGPSYSADFQEIAQKVEAIDPAIKVYCRDAQGTTPLPVEVWNRPALTVAVTSVFAQHIRRGPILKNHQILKLAQVKILRENGINSPAIVPFRFGMKLDPILFGKFVLIKPMDLELTSKGDGIQIFRRERLEKLTPSDFPRDHKLHQDQRGYLVTKFIYTGKYPSYFRLTTFCGGVLYIMKHQCTVATPDLDSPDHIIESGNVTAKFNKEFILERFPELHELASKVATAFPQVPLLGMDAIIEEATGKIYVLEVNPGGNTWHFSSPSSLKRRQQHPDLVDRMKAQYGAFDVAAQALASKTRALAE